MSGRWVRNKTTGFILDVPADHWCLTHANFEEVANPYLPKNATAVAPLPDNAYRDLPHDFPSLAVLREHGYETLGSLDGLTQAALERLRGVGPAKAKAILAARADLLAQ